MNILFVWTSPFKNGGGVGRVTRTLGEEFIKRGHEVYYLSFSTGDKYIDNGIPQFFCPKNDNPKATENVRYLKQLISERDIDVIINQAAISNPEVLRSINRALSGLGLDGKIKLFTVHHNCVKCLHKHFELVLRENYKNHWLSPIISNSFILKLLKKRHKRKYRRIINYLIESSTYLVLLSEHYIPDLETYLFKVPDEKIVGISNPVPFEVKDAEQKKENRLLFVGRVNFQQKRADFLISLWKRLQTKHPTWEFDIVGDGEALIQLKEKARKEKLERIHFHGFQDPIPYLEKAKFFVMTSAFEGFPMVLVEAQAYGVVPVAFNSFSSLSDILEDQVNGLVIEPFNIALYTDRLGKAMQDEDQRVLMSKRARESVGKFHSSKIAQDWEGLFMD